MKKPKLQTLEKSAADSTVLFDPSGSISIEALQELLHGTGILIRQNCGCWEWAILSSHQPDIDSSPLVWRGTYDTHVDVFRGVLAYLVGLMTAQQITRQVVDIVETALDTTASVDDGQVCFTPETIHALVAALDTYHNGQRRGWHM